MGFGRAALCKGRKAHPRAEQGNFGNRVSGEMSITLPGCLAGSQGDVRGLSCTPGPQPSFWGLKAPFGAFQSKEGITIPGM